MKRLLIVPVVAALAVATLAPARAGEVPEKKPTDIFCQATGGYNASDLFKIHSDSTNTGVGLALTHCLISAPDSARPLGPPDIDPAHPEPWWPLLFWAAESSPIAQGGRLKLEANGDFACGEGTLARANTNNFVRIDQGIANFMTWGLDWSATFENGVGEVSGTAWKGVTNGWDPDKDETRDISGTIVIDDGSATGNCDDSGGAVTLYIHFRLS